MSTIQEIAYSILKEYGKPMPSKEVAQLALKRGLIQSSARDPIVSMAQTIEKNIRDSVEPELKFIYGTQRNRLIALPTWDGMPLMDKKTGEQRVDIVELKARISIDLHEQVQLAAQSKIASGFDETVSLLLRRGLIAEAIKIKEGLMKQLQQLNRPMSGG